ncbi:hypothetical protein CDL12_18241 [Handroanthus impetiginosus]|uniref:CRM domain-containing protein n=1 Tax=Handroanthus impetiginosus TaxID=429701 RepID=A0A2G9GV64_9LAMI|nr:hypothetical protein CDL12_18241 [Handroanthus impetiginosus]
MALKTQFPLFAPPQLRPEPQRFPTEIRFSRWNNANAQKFIREERTQKELEDQLRFEKRFDSALSIAHNFNPAPPHPTTFKSTGTPSAPSAPSIPGKRSKYSKNPASETLHPAFKPLSKPQKIPVKENGSPNPASPNFVIDENGVSYEMPDAPFVYQYSYTETPKAKPVKLREPLVSPFGPETMAKPWLGRKPLPPSKKKLPEFDSFQLPPPHKKGVKPVQSPGPFLPGSGPKYVKSREEILGAPLTKEEIEELINACKKSNRQLNIGRDGLTHNMLDNIHALWKRRRVCKIKCKGVCTVDMDNVCQQLEEKTGGKIIYHKGGIIYLFRGRNYNYKSRPRFPLMLWKPVSPVYPRLIKRVPEGLTLEEATDMRKRGRDLTPICKLAKNGVYCDLVKNIREAFEACELVRINCQGLNPSDYRKIGAKLKDLVPCVLLSFENEHILIWRGRDWKSSLEPNQSLTGSQEIKADVEVSGLSAPPSPSSCIVEANSSDLEASSSKQNTELTKEVEEEPIISEVPDTSVIVESDSEACNQSVKSEIVEPQTRLETTKNADEQMNLTKPCTEGILLLRKEAAENGLAFLLENDDRLDADTVFKRAVAFAKTAPAGPVFTHRPKKSLPAETNKKQECDEGIEIIAVSGRRNERKSHRVEKLEDVKGDYLNVVPTGNLRVDELAKLLA